MKTIQTEIDYLRETGLIIRSSAYSRYDKTMAFPADSERSKTVCGAGITRRWLHVQLVSHTARQITRLLGLNDDLAEAIALGHDLGHPPYGHEGEAYLNALCIESGCGFFVHNAQSARILTVFEKGLDLSLPVLDGILCHNGEMLYRQYVPNPCKTREWFEAELNTCFRVEHLNKEITPMTPEGCVVRASDVIAYIGRDIEDAIAVGLITRGDIPDVIVSVLGDTEASIRSHLIADVVRTSSSNIISFSERVFEALAALMAFNYRAIYALVAPKWLRRKRERSFRVLFHSCCEQLQRGMDSDIARWVHAMDDGYVRSTSTERMVVDYIACMTDAFFEEVADRATCSN